MGCMASRGCRQRSSRGNLSCRSALCAQPLTAVGQRSRPAGSEHAAKPTREFPGPGKRERGQTAPGPVESRERYGRNSTGLCCVAAGK